MNYILKERYSIFTHKISLNYYKKINILYYVKPTESANVSLIRLVLLLFDVEQQEDARERSCLLISVNHIHQSWSLSTSTRTGSLWSEVQREVVKLRLGSVPAGKKEREGTVSRFPAS